ncbi:MAG: VOC family protein [Nocardia sp.]|nr:VOC family protein [Nocardia sp.]
MTTTTTNPTLFHTLRANDASALIAYLVRTFGFVESVTYRDDAGKVAHAELNWPEGHGGVMLGDHRPDTTWSLRPGSAGCYVVTSDPDALYARVVDAGAEVIRPLEDTEYGSREFAVRDPEGNLWSFGSYGGHTGD